MAANIERIQQQMQSELEKFKAIQKGKLWVMWYSKVFCEVSSKTHSSEHFCETGNKLLFLKWAMSVFCSFRISLIRLFARDSSLHLQIDYNSLFFCHV